MRHLAKTSRSSPQLYLARGFLDLALCRELTQDMREGRTRPAAILGQDGTDIIDERRRRTLQAAVSPDGRLNVEQRLLALKTDLEHHFNVKVTGLQKPQFLRYGRGSFFRPHQDSSGRPDHDPHVRARRISAVVFLNRQARLPDDEAYCGGDLWLFRLDDDPDPTFCIAGETGMLVAFPSEVFHEVRPVTHGERFTVVAWYVNQMP
jgi:SM-20-related protein